jgi:glycosyltransferase involved in cell wall biosynthesis
MRALCQRAALIMVFTETARRMVVEQGLAELERVRVVPHGAPDELTQAAWADGVDEDITSSSLQLPSLAGRTVLSTFGLISDSKGLELAIRALPSIVASHPQVLYLIAGQTHPDVIDKEGESYRLGLQRLVHDLDLCDHVWFIDRFLSIDELAMLLARTDLYLTPYRSRDQIVSGALTFAVAAGCPVVSTPYFYAEDLLSSGAGRLVPAADSSKLAAAVLDLLGSPAKMKAARAEARRVGADLTWASVGKTTLELLSEVAQGAQHLARL